MNKLSVSDIQVNMDDVMALKEEQENTDIVVDYDLDGEDEEKKSETNISSGQQNYLTKRPKPEEYKVVRWRFIAAVLFSFFSFFALLASIVFQCLFVFHFLVFLLLIPFDILQLYCYDILQI